jgi:hypothetical protein
MDRVNPELGYDPQNPNIVQVPHYFRTIKFVQIALSIFSIALSGASLGLLDGLYTGAPGYSVFVVSKAENRETQDRNGELTHPRHSQISL